MIKFRCSQCQQKIAVNDEGAGYAISCPTCAENLIVPPETAPEFRPVTEALRGEASETSPFELLESDRKQLAANRRVESPLPAVREAVAPHLARLMMNRLTQALLSQRQQLLAAQRESTQRVAEIEERVSRLQEQFQKRASAYEKRIAALEFELARKAAENDRLVREKFLLSKRRLEQENGSAPARVELRDAGFLIGA